MIGNEPIGLGGDWIQGVLRAWSKIRKERILELDAISNEFGDPELLAKRYVEPDYQPTNPADYDEDEPISSARFPISQWTNSFLRSEFLHRDGRNTVFILGDAGMGKTSFLMMLKFSHLSKFWPESLSFRLLRLGRGTLEEIQKIQHRRRTVLMLDSLDEDPLADGRVEERLDDILRLATTFRQTIITCRTQFFPKGRIEKLGKIELSHYSCNLIYLAPFSDEQISEYLSRIYPNSWKDALNKMVFSRDNRKLERAKKTLVLMRSLRMRPMLLSYIEDLEDASFEAGNEYDVYEVLVRKWLMRERRKISRRDGARAPGLQALFSSCQRYAMMMNTEKREGGAPDGIDVLSRQVPEISKITLLEVGGRSLLSKTSGGEIRFAHYSIQEFLVARSILAGSGIDQEMRMTPQIFMFIRSAFNRNREIDVALLREILSRFRNDLRGFDISELDLRGMDFSGAVLDGSNLSGSQLDSSCLEGASMKGVLLRRASVKDVRMSGCDLTASQCIGSDFSGADLSSSIMNRADLSYCTISRAKVTAAQLFQANLSGSTVAFCDFAGSRLDRAVLRAVRFEVVSLRNTSLRDSEMEGVEFKEVLLDGADLTGARMPLRAVRA